MSPLIGILLFLCVILVFLFIIRQKSYMQETIEEAKKAKESSSQDKEFYIKAIRRYLNYSSNTDGEVLAHISKYSSTNIYCYILYVLHSNKALHGTASDSYEALYEELNSVTTADKTIFKYLGTYEMKNPQYKDKTK